MNCITFMSTWVHPRFFGGVRVAHLSGLLSHYVSLRTGIRVRYDFRIKTMFGSFLPPVVCRRAHDLFTLLCLLAHSGVQHILGCVFALFFFVLYTICCQFLWIAPSVFSNVYYMKLTVVELSVIFIMLCVCVYTEISPWSPYWQEIVPFAYIPLLL